MKKNGGFLPSVFSHVHTKGCSIQRESVATSEELFNFIKSFLEGKDDRIWVGALTAKCRDIRNITAPSVEEKRAVCAYDTAKKENPAHGELCQTRYVIEQADQVELRRNLFAAFGEDRLIKPASYRGGSISTQLPPSLQERVRK